MCRRKITWEGWEDSAIPPERLGSYLRKFRKLLDELRLCLLALRPFRPGMRPHPNRLRSRIAARGSQQYRSFVEEAADLVVDHGGSLSGEHGDGQSRGELLPKMFGP